MQVYEDRKTRILFYSDEIVLLSWFREIETLESDSAVMVYGDKKLEFEFTVMILYYYVGL